MGNYILDYPEVVMYNRYMETTRHQEQELIRLAMEFCISRRGNAELMSNDEFRHLSDACEAELSRRAEARRIFGRAGSATFATQEQAEAYLIGMPEGYNGRTSKIDGKWMVSYRLEGK